jgi:hypothetical protein
MKIPAELKIKKYQYLYTNKGKMYIYKNNLLPERYDIMAVLNGLIHYSDISDFPYVFEGINKNKLIFDIKIYLLAEKMGCKLYDYHSERNFKIIVKDMKYLKDMLLHRFIIEKENISILSQYVKEIKIIVNHILKGIKKNDTKNLFLYRYLTLYFPDELKSKIDTQQQLNDIIESKYKLIKKYDNFESFNKFFIECYQNAENLIRKNRNTPDFNKFFKTESKKLTPVRFNPCKSLINPLYTNDVVTDLEKFSLNIHLRPKHSLKL